MHRPIRSYMMRGGRLGPGQELARAELGPRFALPFVAAKPRAS
jgi:tRNA (guanine-N7-)-methyltransferase